MKMFSFLGFVAALTIFALYGFSTEVFATCPPGTPPNMACSENYQMQIPQGAPQTIESNQKTASLTKTELTAKEKALERDHDQLIKIFEHPSKSDYCNWGSLDGEYLEWLTKNQDIVVDRKEYPSPSYKIKSVAKYNGTAYSQCTTMLVVHYHKTNKGAEKK